MTKVLIKLPEPIFCFETEGLSYPSPRDWILSRWEWARTGPSWWEAASPHHFLPPAWTSCRKFRNLQKQKSIDHYSIDLSKKWLIWCLPFAKLRCSWAKVTLLSHVGELSVKIANFLRRIAGPTRLFQHNSRTNVTQECRTIVIQTKNEQITPRPRPTTTPFEQMRIKNSLAPRLRQQLIATSRELANSRA